MVLNRGDPQVPQVGDPNPKLPTSVYYFGVFSDLEGDLDFPVRETHTKNDLNAARVYLRFSVGI